MCGQLRDDIRGTLLDEGYVIMDLEPELVVTNTTLTFADIMSSSEPVRTFLPTSDATSHIQMPERLVTLCALCSARSWASVSARCQATKAYARAADMVGTCAADIQSLCRKFAHAALGLWGQIVNFINDTILTLLLMLMMLGTREGCVLLHRRSQPSSPG